MIYCGINVIDAAGFIKAVLVRSKTKSRLMQMLP